MARPNWREIRDAIKRHIKDRTLEPGARLPTEPTLAAAYGAGRHSVRRALAELAKEGHLSVEQGRGTFVSPRPRIDYAIGRRTRMRRNMDAQGVSLSRVLVGVDRLEADDRIAAALGLAPGSAIIATHRMSLADGLPVSFGTLYHDATRFPDFPERCEFCGSVTGAYETYGIADYVRGSTEIHARPARADEAQRLRQHPDMPVLVVRAVDTTLDGAPLACSEVIWSAARVKFSITQEDDCP